MDGINSNAVISVETLVQSMLIPQESITLTRLLPQFPSTSSRLARNAKDLWYHIMDRYLAR